MAKRQRSASPTSYSKRQVSVQSTTSSYTSEEHSTNGSRNGSFQSSPLASPVLSTSKPSRDRMSKTTRHGSQQLLGTVSPAKRSSLDSTCSNLSSSRIMKTECTSLTDTENRHKPSGSQCPTPSTTDPDPANDTFPIFLTGDVFINCDIVTPPRRWQLHSAVLKRHSTWFRDAIAAASQNSDHEREWSFRLADDDDRQLRLKPAEDAMPFDNSKMSDGSLDASNHGLQTPPASATPSHVVNDNFNHAVEVGIYDAIFGTFYNIPITIPTTSVSDTLIHSDSILRIADDLSITALISTQVSTALKSHRHSLYGAIAQDPARYLLLAIQLRDTAIYTEAMIHIVGAYPSWPKHWIVRPKSLPPSLISLIARKAADLTSLITDVQNDLLKLTINKTNDEPVAPSASSASEFNTWFIVNLFRDTLVREFNDLGNKPLKLGELFRAIGKGGDAYMPYEETRELVEEAMPCALDNLREDLDMLKECAQGYAEEVIRNRTLVDVEKGEIGWLTCAKIEEGDIYWEMEQGEGEGCLTSRSCQWESQL